jgi:hypothetical protein
MVIVDLDYVVAHLESHIACVNIVSILEMIIIADALDYTITEITVIQIE